MAQFTWPAQSSTVSIPSVGTNGAAAPTSSELIGVKDGSGNLQPVTQGQAAMAASIPVVIASNQSAVSVTGPLTDTQLRATAVPVSGPLTDSQLRATAVPVSGPLTDTQLRATAVPVSGTFWQATQPVSGPLTDSQLRATAVPVSLASVPTHAVTQSGTWTVQPGNTANTTAWLVSSTAKTPVSGAITQAAVTVGTTAVRATVAGTAPSANRQILVITIDPASTAKFYIGSSTVTASGATRGIPLQPGQTFRANDDAGDYFIISDTAAQTVFIMEH